MTSSAPASNAADSCFAASCPSARRTGTTPVYESFFTRCRAASTGSGSFLASKTTKAGRARRPIDISSSPELERDDRSFLLRDPGAYVRRE